jgi:hypothetical protein
VKRRSYALYMAFHSTGAAAAGKKYGGSLKKKLMCLLFGILRQGVNALSNGEWKDMYDRPSQSSSRMAVYESDSTQSRDGVT